MGSLSGVEAEIGRLAQAVESYADATDPVRGRLRDLPVEEAAPGDAATAVVAAVRRLEQRLAALGEQAQDAARVLRAVQTAVDDDVRHAARTDTDPRTTDGPAA